MPTSKSVIVFGPGLQEQGGMAKRTRLFARGLAERGWTVHVLARTGPSRRLRLQSRGGIKILEVPGFGIPPIGGLLYLAVAIPIGIFWSRRATVLLAIQLKSPATAAAVCSSVVRHPFVALTTTTGQLSEVDYVTAGIFAPLRRRLLRRAGVLVAQTVTGARELERLVEPDRVKVLPSPVHLPDPPPLNGKPAAMFSGRLSSEKDLFTLLEAWRAVMQEQPAARLSLVGSGGHYRSVETELRQVVAGDPVLQQAVTFTGWVEDVASYLRTTDVYVLPSTSEGMSNALLEACAHGRVVVASDIPGNTAVLGEDYPLLYPPGNAAALAAQLQQALSDDDTRKRARDAVLRRMQTHNADVVIAQLEEILTAAASGYRSHRQKSRGTDPG